MTRQKNEIANGVRLENASWRTWWKQRNKLKTITPETLNWLKDSDVTWLYGPFHSALDDAPPKPKPIPDSVDKKDQASAHDRLDLSTTTRRPQHAPSKPILKHRSISELLLAAGEPSSPVFSPPESDEDQDNQDLDAHISSSYPKRPSLLHTKSDTHITRWGPSRVFRKDSPPRIAPPTTSVSSSHLDTFFAPDIPIAATGCIKPSRSQDSHTSGTSTSERSAGSGERKKKHISFNTFVEQCIAIEKPKKNTGSPGAVWNPEDDDGYEEDQEYYSEEDEEAPWDHLSGSAIGSDSDSPYEEDDEEEILQMRSRGSRTPGKKGRSKSKTSTTSSSSSASTSTTSTSSSDGANLHRRHSSALSSRNRRASNSTYRPNRRPPPLIRTHSEHVQHVTIAPIAPTILKTGTWREGFGDDGGVSDDGFNWGRWGVGGGDGKNHGRGREDDTSDGTPVELVYVPPFGSNYSLNVQDDDEIEEEEEEEEDEEDEYLEDAGMGMAMMNTGSNDGDDDGVGDERIETVDQGIYHHLVSLGDYSDPHPASAPIPVPTVVVQQRGDDDDAYRFFGNSDFEGTEYAPGFGVQTARRVIVTKKPEEDEEPERGRSRSRSRSRTPSPAMLAVSASPTTTSNGTGTVANEGTPEEAKPLRFTVFAFSITFPSPSRTVVPGLAVPEGDARSIKYKDEFLFDIRSLYWWCVCWRRIDREREREKERREKERGGRGRERESTKRVEVKGKEKEMVATSIPLRLQDPVRSSEYAESVSSTSSGTVILEKEDEQRKHQEEEERRRRDQQRRREEEHERIAEEELLRKIHPTPSNSPILSMRPPPPSSAEVTPSSSSSNISGSGFAKPSLAGTPSLPSSSSSTLKPAVTRTTSGSSTSSSSSKPPLLPSPPLPAQASTSLTTPAAERMSISVPAAESSSNVSQSQPQPQSPKSPTSPTGKEGKIIGKAVGMVSSAGAYLGLWQHYGGS
ncbi:hypothetical protein BDQ17DRAFT_1324922 [Cyathus striatus]|nr:hypothetical protein BDQ17DRAFT_1324922 [Cyathus striatus]